MVLISRPFRSLLGCVVLAAASLAVADDVRNDTMQLINGDLLHGSLVAIDPATGVSWRHEYVKEPILFSPESLSQIKFSNDTPPGGRGQVSIIHLTNDDVLHGKLLSLRDGKLRLSTSYAKEIVIRKPMVERISLVPSSDIVFTGPSSAEQWDFSSASAWRYKDDALYCNGSGYAGAHVGLPDAAQIDFTVQWRGSYPYFRFAFYTANLRSYSSQSYSFRSSSSYLRMYRYGGRGNTSLPSHNHSGFAGKSKARFRIFADKKSKRIIIFMDDQKVVQWAEPHEWVGAGNSITFYGYQSHPLKVTDFVVSRWDGKTLPENDKPARKPTKDVLELVNGDKVTGTLSGIDADKLSFKTSYAAIEVPVQRASSITMSGETAERARRNRNDARIHLADGGSITLDLQSLAEQRIVGKSEAYDSVTVSLNSVVKMDFNIYDEREQAEDEDNW